MRSADEIELREARRGCVGPPLFFVAVGDRGVAREAEGLGG